jgi:hypothetical protein
MSHAANSACTAGPRRKPRVLFVPEATVNKVLGRLDVKCLAVLMGSFPKCQLEIERRTLICRTAHNNQRQECALAWIVALDTERNC